MDFELIKTITKRESIVGTKVQLVLEFSLMDFLSIEELEIAKSVDRHFFVAVFQHLIYLSHRLGGKYSHCEVCETTWNMISAYCKSHVYFHIPFHLKIFYSTRNFDCIQFQCAKVIRGIASTEDQSMDNDQMFRIREIFPLLPRHNLSVSFSTIDFLCIAGNSIQGIRENLEVLLLTFIDIHGKYTGQRYALFDLEHVVQSNDNFFTSTLSLPHNSRLSTIHGSYHQHSFHKTASSIFEMCEMMQTNRFFSTDKLSCLPLTWMKRTGEKSFLNNSINNFPTFHWLRNRQLELGSLSINHCNPDIIDCDHDIFRMVSYYHMERKEQFYRFYNRKWDFNTYHFPSPYWLSNVLPNNLIRISNLPYFISDDELYQKLFTLCSITGQVIGFAGYYLPPMHRHCQFVFIGFKNTEAATMASIGLQHYLLANSFLTVEKIEDFQFCITHSGDDNAYYSVYSDSKVLERLDESSS